MANYDVDDAMIYIFVVICWYSFGVAFMLGMQILTRSTELEDLARRRTRFYIRTLRNQTNTKEILEELVDKQKRDRLWDIYLGTTCDSKDRLTRVESSRIRRIEKQLATMKRNHRLTQDNLFPESSPAPSTEERPESRRMPSITSSILRRRSSFDQQTLEQWKQLATQTTTSEQLPSAIRRVMMRRSFRRSAQKSSPPVPRRSSTIIPTVRREQHVRALSSNCYPHLIRDRR